VGPFKNDSMHATESRFPTIVNPPNSTSIFVSAVSLAYLHAPRVIPEFTAPLRSTSHVTFSRQQPHTHTC